MGSRDAECYLASPAVVAASAIAGYICGPRADGAGNAARAARFEKRRAPPAPTRRSRSCRAFPRASAGVWSSCPGQPEHRRHLRQGLHLPRRHDAGDDGPGRLRELRPGASPAGASGRRDRRRLELRHRLEPRAGGDLAAGQGHRDGHRRQLLADLPAQRVQQRLPVHRVPRAGRPHARADRSAEIESGEKTIIPATRSRSTSPRGRSPSARRRSASRRWARCRRRWSSPAGSRTRSAEQLELFHANRPADEGSKEERDGQVHRGYDARRRHRQGVLPEARSRAGRRRLRRRLRPRRHRLGVLDQRGQRAAGAHVELLAQHKLGLFGAITSKPKDRRPRRKLKPELRDKGTSTSARSSAMRQRFNWTSASGPAARSPGNPLNFIRRTADGGFEEPAGRRGDLPPEHRGHVRRHRVDRPAGAGARALATHPKFKGFADTPNEDLAISTRVFTRNACRRILTAAFEYAKKARLQVGHDLREAQRAARDLGNDGRGEEDPEADYPTSSTGRPTSTRR